MLDHWYSIDWLVQQTAEPVWQWSWWAVGSRYNTVKSRRYFIRIFCYFSPRWPRIPPQMEQTCYFTPRWPRIPPQMEKNFVISHPDDHEYSLRWNKLVISHPDDQEYRLRWKKNFVISHPDDHEYSLRWNKLVISHPDDQEYHPIWNKLVISHPDDHEYHLRRGKLYSTPRWQYSESLAPCIQTAPYFEIYSLIMNLLTFIWYSYRSTLLYDTWPLPRGTQQTRKLSS